MVSLSIDYVRITGQGLCPFVPFRMVSDQPDPTGTRTSARGGLSASMYFLAVLLWIPNSRAIPRIDSPLRFAFCTALHLAI